MGKMQRRIKAWMTEYAYLVTMLSVLAVVVGCAMYTQALRQDVGVQAAAEAPETKATFTPAPTLQATPLPTIAAIRPAALTGMSGQWPASGEMIRGYDAREAVYWAALGCWQVHAAVDIAGQAGERIAACTDGNVLRTAWDEMWGWQVCIGLEDGMQLVYAGLEACLVYEEQMVKRGQTLGTLLAAIPCEAEMETHLHMEAYQNGDRTNPEKAVLMR